MKKIYALSLLAAVTTASLMPAGIAAQPLLSESFDYTKGNLYQQGGWVKPGYDTKSPIQVTGENLTFKGYQDEAKGNAARLVNSASGLQDLAKKFTEGENVAVKTGSIYYSALIRIDDISKLGDIKSSKINYFLSLMQAPTATQDIADGKSGTEFGKLFVAKGSADDKFQLGVERKDKKPAFTTAEYTVGETYLIVVKYEIIDGDNNDVVSLYVNPAAAEEPSTADAVYNGTSGYDTTNGLQGIVLSQTQKSSSQPGPAVTVDELRVATSYADLFPKAEIPEEKPELFLSATEINVEKARIGTYVPTKINIRATASLKGDVFVSQPKSGQVIVNTNQIDNYDVTATTGEFLGYNLIVSVVPTDPAVTSDEITLTAEDIDPITIPVKWSYTDANDPATLLSESFDYKTGDLHGKNGWMRFGQQKTATLRVSDTNLTYPGYCDKAIGRAVTLENNVKLGEDLVRKFTHNPGEAVISGSIYYSALVKVDDVSTLKNAVLTKGNFIMALVQKPAPTTDLAEDKNSTAYAGLFIMQGSDDEKFKFGLEKYGQSVQSITEKEYDIHKTYLVVVRYEIVPGDNNDKISLYVNPTSIEPAKADLVYSGDDKDPYEYSQAFGGYTGLQGILLNQGKGGNYEAPLVILDELRVAQDYAALFPEMGSVGEITTDATTISRLLAASPDITVYDLAGRTVKTEKACTSIDQLRSNLARGIYIANANGKTIKFAVGSRQ